MTSKIKKEPTTLLTIKEADSLVRAFLDQSLPIELWTHEAHLITGLWHLLRHTNAEATHLLRCRIIEYNNQKGPGNSIASGYHETITLLWIWIMEQFIKENQASDHLSIINRFLRDPLASGAWMDMFYSSTLLASDDARARWTEPDIQPLDFSKAKARQ